MFNFGIATVDERGTAHMDCGKCHADGSGTIGYALVVCPAKHFDLYCAERRRVEHVRTHKRRRKNCEFCNGVAA